MAHCFKVWFPFFPLFFFLFSQLYSYAINKYLFRIGLIQSFSNQEKPNKHCTKV